MKAGRKKLILRNEDTGEELEIGPLVGFEVGAAAPTLVDIAVRAKVRYEVAADLVEAFREDYHPRGEQQS